MAAWTGITVAATACSVYGDDVDVRANRPEGGAPDAGHTDGGQLDGGTTGSGGAAGSGGAGGTSGSGGSSGGTADGAAEDTGRIDADAMAPDAMPPPDASWDQGSDSSDIGPLDDGNAQDTSPGSDVDASDISDASTNNDASDGDAPPNDAPSTPDAARDADASRIDASDSGPTGRQILPQHGAPIEMPDAGGPFDSRCASDEVITGFVGRAGVQTDALASTCSKLIGGVLSSPRNLPLNGNLTGGMPFTVTCPANYVAVGIVGRFGHNTMWNEDITTMIGVVCQALASTTTQIVTITGQPALDPGYTSFREDCTGGRYLTDISGRTDTNSLGFTVQQVGGECEPR